MRDFLDLLQQGARPKDLTSKFPAAIGPATFEALVATGILEEGDIADWYPCPGGGDECPRRVVPNPGDAEHPFVAVPGSGVCCKAVPLREEDLATHTTSIPAFVRVLRELLGLDGVFDLDEELFPCTVRIGQTVGEGLPREVLLATWPSCDGFAAFLRSRRGLPRGTLVLAPVRSRWLSPDLEAQHGPGEKVELAFLEDLLEVRDGRLRRTQHTIGPGRASAAAQPSPFCLLIAHDGRRTLDEAEYRDVVARAEAFDLFVDEMSKVEAGRCRAGRRGAEGTFCEATLTHQQAQVIVELIERRQGLRAGELAALGFNSNPEKVVETARRAVDERVGRYQWRTIQTLRGEDSKAKRYLFHPPEGFRYAVLRPLDPTS